VESIDSDDTLDVSSDIVYAVGSVDADDAVISAVLLSNVGSVDTEDTVEVVSFKVFDLD